MFEAYKNEPYSSYKNPKDIANFQNAIKEVKKQLGKKYPLVIGGKKIETGDYLESINPSNLSEIIGYSAKAKQNEIDLAFDAANQAFKDWSQWSMESRARAIAKLAAVMRRRKLELSAWLTLEAGKNYVEAEADVAEAIDFCEYYARQSLALGKPIHEYDFQGQQNISFLKPIGVGIVISPWNFPLAILAGMAVGPVVVGNTVILKPAPSTPIIAQKFMECVAEAGFPDGVFNLLTGEDADLGDQLVDDIRTRFINFTGSFVIGKRITERAAIIHPKQKWIKKVYVELGGKDALIVDETANLQEAADIAIASGFGFQGQKCSAMSRLIVVAEIHDAFVEVFTNKLTKLEQGAAETNAGMGAVVNEKAVEKIMSYIDIGKKDNKLLFGGERGSDDGYYIKPTVFVDVAPDDTLAQDEIFGPVVSVIKAKDFDDALNIANNTPYGLTGGLVSKKRDRLERARKEFNVGNLYLNRKITGALVGVQPFGGFNLSGSNAKAGGPDYLRLFMEMKTVSEQF